LGQASGVAAALAVEGKTAVQKVVVERLQAKLREQKAVLSPEGLSKSDRGIDASKLAGIVVDDSQATKTGDWVASASVRPFVGEVYIHDNNEAKGQKRIRYTPKVLKDGKYEVRLYYTANAN